MILAGVLACFGGLKALLKFTNQVIVQKESFVSKEEIAKNYISMKELARNYIPKGKPRKLFVTSEELTILEDLISKGEAIHKMNGENLVFGFNSWHLKAERVIESMGIEKFDLDDACYFEGQYPKSDFEYQYCLSRALGVLKAMKPIQKTK